MKECICNNFMSFLVNGSPFDDLRVGKVLSPGDPLTPFIFLIVAEGLTTLTNRATKLGKLYGYKIYQTLQYKIL